MKPRLLVAIVAVVVCASAGACTSGGGGSGYPSPVPGGEGNEPGGSTYEPPGAGSGQDPKGSGNEPGGSTYEPPGESSSGGMSSGGGSSSGGTVCLACSTYDCQVVSAQGSATTTIALTPNSGGGCVEASVGDVLLCDGSVVVGGDDAGTVIGTWTSTGPGFTASVAGVSFTCTPAAAGGGSFSPTPTEDGG